MGSHWVQGPLQQPPSRMSSHEPVSGLVGFLGTLCPKQELALESSCLGRARLVGASSAPEAGLSTCWKPAVT